MEQLEAEFDIAGAVRSGLSGWLTAAGSSPGPFISFRINNLERAEHSPPIYAAEQTVLFS